MKINFNNSSNQTRLLNFGAIGKHRTHIIKIGAISTLSFICASMGINNSIKGCPKNEILSDLIVPNSSSVNAEIPNENNNNEFIQAYKDSLESNKHSQKQSDVDEISKLMQEFKNFKDSVKVQLNEQQKRIITLKDSLEAYKATVDQKNIAPKDETRLQDNLRAKEVNARKMKLQAYMDSVNLVIARELSKIDSLQNLITPSGSQKSVQSLEVREIQASNNS